MTKTLAFFAYLSLFFFINPARLTADEQELVFLFQKQKDPASVEEAAQSVAGYLSNEIEKPVKVVVPGNYSASVQALVSKQADFAYVSSLPFLLAKRDGNASIVLAEQRPDIFGKQRTEYDSVLVVRKDSDISDVEDLKKHHKELRFAFTSPTSTSGYVFAFWRLVKEGLLKPEQDPSEVFKSVSFAGSYSQALDEVISGRADICAVSNYTVEGKKALKYLSESKLKQIKILTRTPGVPTHVITVREGIDQTIVSDVKKALLKMSADRPELLEDIYGTSKFVEVSGPNHVAKTAEAVSFIGLPVGDLM